MEETKNAGQKPALRPTYRSKTSYQKALDSLAPAKNPKKRGMSRVDWIIFGVMTVAALLMSFCSLGSFSVPETYWESSILTDKSDYAIFAKDMNVAISEVWVYTGVPETESSTNDLGINKVSLEFGTSEAYSGAWQNAAYFYAAAGQIVDRGDPEDAEDDVTHWSGGMYRWQKARLAGGKKLEESSKKPYFKLETSTSKTRVLEIVLINAATGKPLVYGEDFQLVNSRRDAGRYAALFDETDKFRGGPSYLTDMYFDEIYHARTAYELIQGWDLYEWTHPPLGKTLISLGIRAFGMNPVGWRCVSALFGALIVPIAYLLAKRLLRSTPFAAVLAGFLLVDGLRLVQARIATLDAISVFLILLSFYFMLRFYEGGFNRDRSAIWRDLLWFALAGVTFGISISVKWTGVYAGIGLFVLFAAYLFRRVREYAVAKANPEDGEHAGRFAEICALYRKNVILLISAGVLCFLAMPFCLYLLSYLPTYGAGYSYLPNDGTVTFWHHFWKNQQNMLGYHSGLVSTHPSQSPWFSWPLDIKGVWFFSNSELLLKTGQYSHIHSMGTPLLYWFSFISLLYFIYYMVDRLFQVRRGELDPDDPLYRSNMRILGVLFTGLLANLLPWVFITRSTYFYHFFPSTFFYFGFSALMLRQFCYTEKKKLFAVPLPGGKSWSVTTGRLVAVCACVLVALNFMMFYPIFTGIPVSEGAANGLFRWIGSLGAHVGI